MINNAFTNILSFIFSFFQIIIYISEFLASKENTGYCLSETDINSTKILNKIINVGRKNFIYVNFASYSNGDMVFLTTSYLSNDLDKKTRIFYGFKKNGRPLLNDSYSYSIEINETMPVREKYESESLVIKESGNTTGNNEYLMSWSRMESLAEIYDFEKKNIYIKNLENLTNCKSKIVSLLNPFIPLISNDTNYYYILGFINLNSEYVIQKHLFKSIQEFKSKDTLIKNITIANFQAKCIESGLSCFQTEQHFIICFFFTSNSSYFIAAYNANLEEMKNFSFRPKIINAYCHFYKCLHLKGEISIFTYYNNSIPVLLFLEYNNNSGFNNIIPEINLNKKGNNGIILFEDYILLNDIIKITENKIYYCSTDKNKETIYIISIYLYNTTYKIRYYIINIKEYGNQYTIHLEMKMHNYNNFLAFAFSHNKTFNSL